MLILRRKAGETLLIGENIKVAVLDINEGSVRLAIDAPKSISILRSELLQAADANRDAAGEGQRPQDLMRLMGSRKEGAGNGRSRRPVFGQEARPAAPPVEHDRAADTVSGAEDVSEAAPEAAPSA